MTCGAEKKTTKQNETMLEEEEKEIMTIKVK